MWKKKQNLLQAPGLRQSPFQGCQIIFIPHQYQMQETCQCFLSYWFKLKSGVSHD